jgi:iron(III) transport system permease protein
MGFVLYPYVYLSARAMFLMQSACVLDVARTLGCGPWHAFWRVAVPLAHPAIAVGVSLAMMETLNDLGAVEFLGVRTLTVSIYSTWTNRASLEGAAQIALFMLAIVVALIAFERWARRHQRYATSAQRSRQTIPASLTGTKALLAFLACAFPASIGFCIPALHLAYQGWLVLQYKAVPMRIWGEALNSIAFAAGGAALTLGCGLVLTYGMRRVKSPLPRLLARISSLGYAIPGTVLAVGLLMPLAAFDNAVDDLARQWFGISTGLLLTGTGTALIFAYVMRFMAVSVGGLEAGYAKISPTIDAAARNLGESAVGVAWRIHIPLLRPALFSAALLVFVDGMKELSATLLLRPFDFETLSTHVYMEASRGTYEDGALAALLIVIAGLVPVVLLARAATPVEKMIPRK